MGDISHRALEKDILVTLMYADVFDMPLTAFEVWTYRMDSSRLTQNFSQVSTQKATYFLVNEVLAELVGKHVIIRKFGMFSLADRSYLINDRIFRMKRSDRKWKQFLKTAWWMQLCPFVRMIAVTGRLATKQIGARSDWDVLIVMESGHIWFGRFFLTVFLHLMGRRRWGKYTKDRVCLNHFFTTDYLEVGMKDLFAAREYAFMFPVFGSRVFHLFEEKNSWIRGYIPDWKERALLPPRMLKRNNFIVNIQKFLEYCLGWEGLEQWARNLQKGKIEKNPKTHLPGAYIVADDHALVFLPHPQGPKTFEKFMDRLNSSV